MLLAAFELDWRDVAKRGVTPPSIVEPFDPVDHGHRQLEPGCPSFPVEEFDLHRSPERLDNGIVVGVSDAAD